MADHYTDQHRSQSIVFLQVIMLSVTNDCLLSWLRCAELLQVWCNEVLKTSSRCAELLLGTDGAIVTDQVKTMNQSLCDLAQQEIYMFKSIISTELSHIMSDQTHKENDIGKCSDVEVCECALSLGLY